MKEKVLQVVQDAPGGRISNEDLYFNLRVTSGQMMTTYRLLKKWLQTVNWSAPKTL